jgi:hypothetical protein
MQYLITTITTFCLNAGVKVLIAKPRTGPAVPAFDWLKHKGKRRMRVRLMSKNRITLPQSVVSRVDAAAYFDATVENGRIVLTPVPLRRIQVGQEKLKGISDADEEGEDGSALQQ